MRARAALALAALLVIAGCQAPIQGVSLTRTADRPSTTRASTTPNETPRTAVGTTAGATTMEPRSPTTPGGTPTPGRPSGTLGVEAGYRYDADLAINATDGLNRTELDAVVGRSMARVERIRGLEFKRSVPVEVISRATYRERHVGGNVSEDRRAFDNAKFEALFLVGEGRDSIAVQRRTLGSTVLGFYSPARERIVIVAANGTAGIAEHVLAHELVHALQDQYFGLGDYNQSTRDRFNAVAGVIEGDARYVDYRYRQRCGANWSCATPGVILGGGGGVSADFHWGLYLLTYFPYSEGSAFVRSVHERRGWAGVNALYRDLPASAEQVIHPAKYGNDTPTPIHIEDRAAGEWRRVRVSSRPDYGVLGQPSLVAAFAYPSFTRRAGRPILAADEYFDRNPDGRLRSPSPFRYDAAPADGWDGDRLHVYRNRTGALAYVWRLAWDTPADAREFAATYRDLLGRWGGERIRPGLWRIRNGSFADAFRIRVENATVTITNAPTVEALSAVRGQS